MVIRHSVEELLAKNSVISISNYKLVYIAIVGVALVIYDTPSVIAMVETVYNINFNLNAWKWNKIYCVGGWPLP